MKGTFSRFIAIAAIVALGTGLLAGLMATPINMRAAGDTYLDESNLYDLRIVSELGLTDDDADAIRAVEGVDEVMPAYMADVFLDAGEEKNIVTRVHGLPSDQIEELEPVDYLNRVEVVEGRLPVKENECVIVAPVSASHDPGLIVGQTLTVSESNGDISDTLRSTEFKIVGVVETAYYFSVETESATIGDGTVSLKIYVGDENFSQEAYSEIFVTVEGARELNAASDEYQDAVDAVAERIEEISGARCEARYAEVKEQAEQELADARAELEDARAEADEKLADAEQQLEDGRAELEENEAKLESAKNEIDSGEKELEANRESLPGTLSQKQQELAAAQAALIDAKAQYEDGLAEIEAQEQALNEAKQQLEVAKQLLPTLESAVTQGEQALPSLKAQADALEQAAQSAEQTAQQAHDTSNINDLNAATAAAQSEYETKKAEREALEAQLAEDPENPDLQAQYAAAQAAEQTAQAAYDTAKAASDAEQARLDGLDSAASSARTQADAAKQTYDAAEQGVAEARAQLDEANRQIAEYEPLITEGEAQLAAAKQKMADAKKQITEAEKQIASGETSLSLAPGLAQLELDLAQSKLDSAKQQYEDGMEQLEDGRAELEQGEAEYAEQKADAEQKLADAEQQIADGEQELAELEVPEWYVFDRSGNAGVSAYWSNIDKLEAITTVFPIFFFLVAALVALTTMTRMVDEERLQIGTFKALGYSRWQIMFKYLFYAWVATLVGGVAGLAFGFTAIPLVIWNAYGTMYSIPTFQCVFHAQLAALGVGAALVCTSLATLNACGQTLRECAAQLLLPKAPAAGKRILLERITPIWRRMKFTHKVTARNLFRYKKRFFMTVIGIAGCTALLVTGFGLKDSISDIISNQFDKIFTYDFVVTLSDEDALEDEAFQDTMGDTARVKNYMAASQQRVSVDLGDREFSVYLFVPGDTAQFAQFIDLHERRSGASIALTDGGVVVTEKFAEERGLSVGSELEIENSDGDAATFTVMGIAENYVENYVYITPDSYRDAFGKDAEMNSVLGILPDGTEEMEESLSEAILAVDGVAGLTPVSTMRTSLDETIASINYVVYVIILCAGMLAFVVLYNLTNINIAERQKEIATIKVLGFYEPEVEAYIYRESHVLTAIGTALGLVGGIFLHMFIMRTVEVDMVMFGREIKPLSFVLAAVLTVVFSLLVNLVMKRKLRAISMVESLKAPE